jgi:hypothetical protein
VDRIKTGNNDVMVYALGNRGADEVALHYGVDRGRGDWDKKNRDVKDQYFRAHKLMIANFRVILTLAITELPETELTGWKREEDLVKHTVDVVEERQRTVRVSFMPDGFFVLCHQGQYQSFFLEADRGTESNDDFLRKMRAYWHFWQQGRHQELYDIDSFRVVVATTTEARKENLRTTTKRANTDQTGSNMFWFTSEECYSLDRPESILEPIWQTSKSGELRSLV